jgi:hypothetical protein
MVENLGIWRRGGFQRRNLQTKFRENRSTGSNFQNNNHMEHLFSRFTDGKYATRTHQRWYRQVSNSDFQCVKLHRPFVYFGIWNCVWLITKQTTSRRQNVDKTVTDSTQGVIIQLEDLKVKNNLSTSRSLNVTQSVSKFGVFLETPQQWYNSSAVSQGAVVGSLRNLLLLNTAESFVKYVSSSFQRTTLVHVPTFSLVVLRPDSGPWPPLRGFAITLIRHTPLGRTPMDEWPSRCRHLWQHTTLIPNRQLCPWRDSNPQPQLASEVQM